MVPQGSVLLDGCSKQGKAEPWFVLPKWLLHGLKKLGLEGQHPEPCLKIFGRQEQPSSPLSHLVVPYLAIEQNISLK